MGDRDPHDCREVGVRERGVPERCFLYCPLPTPPLAPPFFLSSPPPPPPPLSSFLSPSSAASRSLAAPEGWCHHPRSQLPLTFSLCRERQQERQLAASPGGHGPGGLRLLPGPEGPLLGFQARTALCAQFRLAPSPSKPDRLGGPQTPPRAPCWGRERHQWGGHTSAGLRLLAQPTAGGRSVGTRGWGWGWEGAPHTKSAGPRPRPAQSGAEPYPDSIPHPSLTCPQWGGLRCRARCSGRDNNRDRNCGAKRCLAILLRFIFRACVCWPYHQRPILEGSLLCDL